MEYECAHSKFEIHCSTNVSKLKDVSVIDWAGRLLLQCRVQMWNYREEFSLDILLPSIFIVVNYRFCETRSIIPINRKYNCPLFPLFWLFCPICGIISRLFYTEHMFVWECNKIWDRQQIDDITMRSTAEEFSQTFPPSHNAFHLLLDLLAPLLRRPTRWLGCRLDLRSL